MTIRLKIVKQNNQLFFDMPGVAGAVLQTHYNSSIQSLILCGIIFRIPSLPTVRARKLKLWERIRFPHLSCVKCHMPHATCHMSHASIIYFHFIGQNGETSQWRVCYHWGCPVFFLYTYILSKYIDFLMHTETLQLFNKHVCHNRAKYYPKTHTKNNWNYVSTRFTHYILGTLNKHKCQQKKEVFKYDMNQRHQRILNKHLIQNADFGHGHINL